MADTLDPNLQADIDAVNRIPIIEDMLDIICRTTGMGFAAVARVTDDYWIACAVEDKINFGLKPGGGLKLETTICNEIRQHHQPVVIDHVAKDEQFAQHHTPAMYGFQSYISMPLVLKNGKFFGTLCAIDPKPAKLNNKETVGMFRFYADLLAFYLQALGELEASETKLQEEQQTSELREQFIAVLGHDLRNPVGAISGAAQVLLRTGNDEKVNRMATIIKNSAYRINELIGNMLDFAKGRLGSGIAINKNDEGHIKEALSHIITELSMLWPDRPIETTFELNAPVYCDEKRLAQLFSNLLGNAFNYGIKTEPVKVVAKSDADGFTLAVSNACEQLPDAVIKNLFKPFSRGAVKSGQDGLGLGLYIAAEIARGHGGTLTVDSNPTETTFTLAIPSRSDA